MTTFWSRLRVVAAEMAATEPARLAEVVRTLLGAAVGVGWLTLDNAAISSVATTAALVVSWLLTRLVRERVVPEVKTVPMSNGVIVRED